MDLVKNILSATKLISQMYFGMAELVDEFLKLWQNNAWGTSIRACSGAVAKNKHGNVIVLENVVKFEFIYRKTNLGRVIFVERDKRKGATGNIVVVFQKMVNYEHLMVNKKLGLDQDRLPRPQDDDPELFLVEDFRVDFNFQAIFGPINIHIYRFFQEGDEKFVYEDGLPYIRKTILLK